MSIYKYPNRYKDTTLNWSKMIEDTNCVDIPWLMKKLGDKENLDVTYNLASNGGSGALTSKVPQTFKNFGYSKGGIYIYYNSSKVCEELKNGYPVLIGGYDKKIYDTVRTVFGFKIDTSYTGGHQWFAHGLLVRTRTITTYYNNPPNDKLQKVISKSNTIGATQTESYEYILCNFGWPSHRGNGYMYSGVFDVDDGVKYSESYSKNYKEDYYQYEVDAVIGIRK